MNVSWSGARASALLVLLLAVLASCSAANTRSTGTEQQGGMPVVVSLPVFVSFVQAVGGNRVTVTSIVPAGSDPHSYQPTPGGVRAVARARAIFVNGAGLESWLNDLLKSAGGSQAPVYTLSEGLKAEVKTASGIEEGNPHFWLDPTDAIQYVRQIERGLSERDPAHASDYQANAERYIGQIQEFDAWAKEQIDRIPPERRKLVTFHDAFPYFGQHFGLDVVGAVERSPGQEPSAREVADLIDQVEALKVRAIFNEPQFSPKLTHVLADEAGVRTLTLYSESPPQGADYIEMMRRNIMTLVEGLG